ncbi:MAG: hypothetical protein LBJ46_01360 [Planctomycetota bacterium]|nr:hypothetical protein [Planctomycetota bacterium]
MAASFRRRACQAGRQNRLIGPDGEILWALRHGIKEQPDFDAIPRDLSA